MTTEKVKTNLVKVRYFITENEMSIREYTYYSVDPLKVGDIVTVPVTHKLNTRRLIMENEQTTNVKAKVSAIDVPESEIEAFKDKVKTIPAQTLTAQMPAILEEKPSDDWKTIKPLGYDIGLDGQKVNPPTPATEKMFEMPFSKKEIKEAMASTKMVTALALTDPRFDATFKALGDQVMGLVRYAESRIIAMDEDVKLVTDDLGMIASLRKAIEDKRTSYVKPFNDHVKEVNGIYKLLNDPLDRADKINRQKVLNYRAEQERKRREAEEINRMREEAAAREAALSGMVATESGVVNPATGEIISPIEKVVVPEAPAAHVHGTAASMGTQKVRKWEVVDQKLVPEEYKIIDAVRVGKVVRAGVPSIPGIRIWEEDSLRITK